MHAESQFNVLWCDFLWALNMQWQINKKTHLCTYYLCISYVLSMYVRISLWLEMKSFFHCRLPLIGKPCLTTILTIFNPACKVSPHSGIVPIHLITPYLRGSPNCTADPTSRSYWFCCLLAFELICLWTESKVLALLVGWIPVEYYKNS